MVDPQRFPDVLHQLLDTYPAVGVESRVTKELMANAGAEEITKHVSANLSHSLAGFIAQNIMLNRPGVMLIEEDHYNDTVRFRAQLHVLSSAEIRSMLSKAFNAGQAEMFQKLSTHR